MSAFRNLGVSLSAGLILVAGSSMAAAGSLSKVCGEIDEIFSGRVIDRLCKRHPSKCELVRENLEELCAKRTILATSSADSDVLDLLEQDFNVTVAEEFSPPGFLAPVVIGPSDLGRPEVLDLVKDAFDVGQTVAITDVNQQEADHFHRLLSDVGDQANCAKGAESTIALYGLQRARTLTPTQLSSYCLASLGDEMHDRETRRWLRQRFDDKPPVPSVDDGLDQGITSLQDDDGVNLAQLASTLHCSHQGSGLGSTFQIDTWVSAVRSFDNSQDLQYVQQSVQYNPDADGEAPTQYFVDNCIGDDLACGPPAEPAFDQENIFTEPATQNVTGGSYSQSQSTTVSGSVGFSAKGPDASASASVTVGQQSTTNVPPVQIM